MTRKQATRQISAILADRGMPAYPDAAKAAGVEYTDYLTRAGAKAKGLKFSTDDETGEEYVYTPNRNRQCSIGWHDECTDPEGDKCGCPCHPLIKLVLAAGARP